MSETFQQQLQRLRQLVGIGRELEADDIRALQTLLMAWDELMGSIQTLLRGWDELMARIRSDSSDDPRLLMAELTMTRAQRDELRYALETILDARPEGYWAACKVAREALAKAEAK